MNDKMLVINTGSTSTKVAIFHGKRCIIKKNIKYHDSLNLQLKSRKEHVIRFLNENKVKYKALKIIVARGGLLAPLKSGVYRINKKMVSDLKNNKYGVHASNLSGIIAFELGKMFKIPSFIVDPVVVDEMADIARVSGLPEISRRSIFHALNQKMAARKVSSIIGKKYEDTNIIVAHLGGGISIGVHLKGKVVDVSNALDGEGPFSPERSGSLPLQAVLRLHKSIGTGELLKRITGCGGLYAYLGTKDCQVVEKLIKKGNKRAKLIYKAMAYQIAKEIGSYTTVLKGKVDAICITGDLARSKILVKWIKERISFLGRIIICRGENEMQALAAGALRVLQSKEKAREY